MEVSPIFHVKGTSLVISSDILLTHFAKRPLFHKLFAIFLISYSGMWHFQRIYAIQEQIDFSAPPRLLLSFVISFPATSCRCLMWEARHNQQVKLKNFSVPLITSVQEVFRGMSIHMYNA